MIAQKTIRQADSRFDLLADCVMNNARPGSPLHAAFAAYDEQRHREGGPGWGAAHMAGDAWRKLSTEEQANVFNGWRWNVAEPSLEQLKGLYAEVALSLSIECGTDGRLSMGPRFGLSEGSTSPVRVFIAEGTDRATALAALQGITAAVEKHYLAAIQLVEGDFIHFSGAELPGPDVEAALDAAQAALDRAKAVVGLARVFPEARASQAIIEPVKHAKHGRKARVVSGK